MGKNVKDNETCYINYYLLFAVIRPHGIFKKNQRKEIVPDLFCKITTPCLLVLVMLYMTYSGTICVGWRTSSKDGRPKMVCKLWAVREQMFSFITCKPFRQVLPLSTQTTASLLFNTLALLEGQLEDALLPGTNTKKLLGKSLYGT